MHGMRADNRICVNLLEHSKFYTVIRVFNRFKYTSIGCSRAETAE